MSREHPAFEMYVCGVLFVCLFIDFTCELIWNVLVNRKGFLYITLKTFRVVFLPFFYDCCQSVGPPVVSIVSGGCN